MQVEGDVIRFPERGLGPGRLLDVLRRGASRPLQGSVLRDGDRADAAELMQDAFLKLWEQWDRIDRIEDSDRLPLPRGVERCPDASARRTPGRSAHDPGRARSRGGIWVGDEDGVIRRVGRGHAAGNHDPFRRRDPRARLRRRDGQPLGRRLLRLAGGRAARPIPDAEKPGLRGPGFGLSAALVGVAGDAGSTYSVEPASSTGGVSGGMMPAPCSNVISPSSTSTMIVSPARNSL